MLTRRIASRHPLAALLSLLYLQLLSGLAIAQAANAPPPRLDYETVPGFFELPPGQNFVEPADVAVNSKGHVYVFHRGS